MTKANLARTEVAAPQDSSQLLVALNTTRKSLYILALGRPNESA
jgi:hypothetical protein